MIIGLSLIHVQFLLVWVNEGWILVQSIQWLFALEVCSLRGKENLRIAYFCNRANINLYYIF